MYKNYFLLGFGLSILITGIIMKTSLKEEKNILKSKEKIEKIEKKEEIKNKEVEKTKEEFEKLLKTIEEINNEKTNKIKEEKKEEISEKILTKKEEKKDNQIEIKKEKNIVTLAEQKENKNNEIKKEVKIETKENKIIFVENKNKLIDDFSNIYNINFGDLKDKEEIKNKLKKILDISLIRVKDKEYIISKDKFPKEIAMDISNKLNNLFGIDSVLTIKEWRLVLLKDKNLDNLVKEQKRFEKYIELEIFEKNGEYILQSKNIFFKKIAVEYANLIKNKENIDIIIMQQ
ncbi:hypothetical protein EV215_1698 [Hypnocyclicus thermotrophus]|uniref:Uncharacterized protein n=1 Tax=Hypnocyclicus thermotrophus TaxID=1627895 RepID=A0AA46I5L6_9FUSO|nr:hypothetical protein [Hypnocyclicus thermotrophus]TDT68631.1 hypothetical protein EV215_1698 [Hypnocyclicus thermotrophus]